MIKKSLIITLRLKLIDQLIKYVCLLDACFILIDAQFSIPGNVCFIIEIIFYFR